MREGGAGRLVSWFPAAAGGGVLVRGHVLTMRRGRQGSSNAGAMPCHCLPNRGAMPCLPSPAAPQDDLRAAVPRGAPVIPANGLLPPGRWIRRRQHFASASKQLCTARPPQRGTSLRGLFLVLRHLRVDPWATGPQPLNPATYFWTRMGGVTPRRAIRCTLGTQHRAIAAEASRAQLPPQLG